MVRSTAIFLVLIGFGLVPDSWADDGYMSPTTIR
jgi:hypothetical protein